MTSYLARDILIATNATAVNASNMVCGCIERGAAAYWGEQINYGLQLYSHFANLFVMLAFVAGVMFGVILLLAADWVYRRKEARNEK